MGATSEIAQQCCKIWLAQGPLELLLAGRSEDKLSRVADDFRIRFPESKVEHRAFDYLSPAAIRGFVDSVSNESVDIVLIAHGSLTSQPEATQNPSYLWVEHEINAISPILFSELFSGVLGRQNHGRLAVFGSVAGDRGRAINHSYGAAKSALATYISGLQQRLAFSSVRVCLIKPGPTRTPMTVNAHIGPSKLSDPKVVAKQIVKGISSGRRVIYAPGIWRQIMLVVRVMPFWLFKRMRF